MTTPPGGDLTALLEKLIAITEAATPGPWEVETGNSDGQIWGDDRPLFEDGWTKKANAQFIAEARTVMPLLLAALGEVLKLHVPVYEDYVDGDGIEGASRDCAECGPPGTLDSWPCPTVQAIRRELATVRNSSDKEAE